MTDRNNTLGANIPLVYHHAMLLDQQRMEGFREAIQLVTPEGGTVLELGGGTGVLSFFAAQRAAKVYCVEKIPASAQSAREFLSKNKNGDRIEVICADAFEYLPPVPVDVVICEMLHVGMVREQQIEVIESFKSRYRAKFGEKLPRFIPEAFIQGIQPLQYSFEFFGYQAQIPVFQPPGQITPQCTELASPTLFQVAQYVDQISTTIVWQDTITTEKAGTLNAVRFILKNLLAIVPKENRSIDWHNNYLILPLSQPLTVAAGEKITLSLNYNSGCDIEDLIEAISVYKVRDYIPLSEQVTEISTSSQYGENYLAPSSTHEQLSNHKKQAFRGI
jgi:predicted RNA methylase